MRLITRMTPLVILLTLTAASADAADEKLRFEAFAVAMGTSNPPIIPSGTRASIQLNVTRWSSDEERGALLTALGEKGSQEMVKLLQKQDEAGWIRVTSPVRDTMGGRMGAGPNRGFGAGAPPRYTVQYARQFPREDGGRRIVLALDRFISFYEAVHGMRSRDYDVTLIVMDVDAEGNGEGQLAMGVKLALDLENMKLVVENFGTEPVRLTNVRQR